MKTGIIDMIIQEPAQFINEFIESINALIQKKNPMHELSRKQRVFLALCIMGILITNKICWTTFQKTFIGKVTVGSLSWMFRCSKIPWSYLLGYAVTLFIQRYGITNGTLCIDDTDKKRSKVTKNIPFVHKLMEKSTGGFYFGQSIVFLILITPIATIPISFGFYLPDPEMSKWKKLDEKLRKKGVAKKERPEKPPKNSKYPTKIEIALNLLTEFVSGFPEIKIKSVVGDALYGTAQFLNQARQILKTEQVISQIRKNQKIRYRGKEISVEEYFQNRKGVAKKLKIRGLETDVVMNGLRVYLSAHECKRFIIALKYQGETEYRYLVASDLSWRMEDIVAAYSLRWLVEVFIQDWKTHEGFNNRTKQSGVEGSSRSLILSLLTDLCLFFHPSQSARLRNKRSAWTAGSLCEKIRKDSLLSVIEYIINSNNPKKRFRELSKVLNQLITLVPSEKHMINRDLGRLEPTPALIYKNKAQSKK